MHPSGPRSLFHFTTFRVVGVTGNGSTRTMAVNGTTNMGLPTPLVRVEIRNLPQSPASDRRLDHFTPRRWSKMRLKLSGLVLRWGRWLSDSGDSVSQFVRSFVRSWGVLRTP